MKEFIIKNRFSFCLFFRKILLTELIIMLYYPFAYIGKQYRTRYAAGCSNGNTFKKWIVRKHRPGYSSETKFYSAECENSRNLLYLMPNHNSIYALVVLYFSSEIFTSSKI